MLFIYAALRSLAPVDIAPLKESHTLLHFRREFSIISSSWRHYSLELEPAFFSALLSDQIKKQNASAALSFDALAIIFRLAPLPLLVTHDNSFEELGVNANSGVASTCPTPLLLVSRNDVPASGWISSGLEPGGGGRLESAARGVSPLPLWDQDGWASWWTPSTSPVSPVVDVSYPVVNSYPSIAVGAPMLQSQQIVAVQGTSEVCLYPSYDLWIVVIIITFLTQR